MPPYDKHNLDDGEQPLEVSRTMMGRVRSMFDERNKLSHLVILAIVIFLIVVGIVATPIFLTHKKWWTNIKKDPRALGEIGVGMALFLLMVRGVDWLSAQLSSPLSHVASVAQLVACVVAVVYFRRHRRNKAFFSQLVHNLLPEKESQSVSQIREGGVTRITGRTREVVGNRIRLCADVRVSWLLQSK